MWVWGGVNQKIPGEEEKYDEIKKEDKKKRCKNDFYD